MLTPESILKNETPIFLLNFDIKTDHLIPVKGPDLMIAKKKKKKDKKKKKGEPGD